MNQVLKKLFFGLQQGWNVVAIVLLFGSTIETAKLFGPLFLLCILIASTTLGGFVLWFLKSQWVAPRPGYLVAVMGACVMATLQGIATFGFAFNLISGADWRHYCLFGYLAGMVGVGIGLLWHWCITKPKEIADRPE